MLSPNPLFDTVVHTCGEQALPILIGCLAVPARRHVFLCSSKTVSIIEKVCKEARIESHDTVTKKVSPFDLNDIHFQLREALKESGDGHIAINITGGTKLMSIACLTLALERNCETYYIDTSNREIIWLNGNRGKQELPPLLKSIAPFIRLSGESIQSADDGVRRRRLEERKKLTSLLAENERLANRIAQMITKNKYDRRPGVKFKIESTHYTAELSEKGDAHLKSNQKNFSFPDMPDFAQYLAGSWFEEYCFLKLLPLLRDGRIFDLRLSLSTTYGNSDQSNIFQELDLVFSNGYELTVVECKSGSVTQEHIQKCENLTMKYGGSFGKGILVTTFPPSHESNKKRIRNSRFIACVSGLPEYSKLSRQVLSIKPGNLIIPRVRK